MHTKHPAAGKRQYGLHKLQYLGNAVLVFVGERTRRENKRCSLYMIHKSHPKQQGRNQTFLRRIVPVGCSPRHDCTRECHRDGNINSRLQGRPSLKERRRQRLDVPVRSSHYLSHPPGRTGPGLAAARWDRQGGRRVILPMNRLFPLLYLLFPLFRGPSCLLHPCPSFPSWVERLWSNRRRLPVVAVTPGK